MNDSPTLKNKITRLIICSVILFSFKYIFHYIFPIIPISELGPASALPPIFGLMFGPWGAGGAALGYLISEIVAGYPPEIYIISFFVQFLYGYIPYKLWYTLGIHKTNSLPRLNTVNNLIKFISIMFITSFVVAGLLGVLMDRLGIYNLVSYTTLVFAFNNFDFAIMLGTLIIIGANIYGIKMIKPDTKVESRSAPRIYKWIGITAIISGAFNVFYSTQNGPDILGWAAGIICYTLVLAYILKPVTKEVKLRKTTIKVSLTEKLIVIFIIIGAIIAMINGIRTILTISYMSPMEFWQTVYLNITLTLSVFYLSSIGFLWYIEKNITTPIESISDIAKNYVSDHKGLGNSQNVISACEQYATENTEIGILVSLFILGGISSACASGNYDGYDPINVAKGSSFELDLNYNEWIDDDGYDHNMLNLTSKERIAPIDGYWMNMYTFKPLKTGNTKITIKQQILWWEDERQVDVNIT